MKPIYHNAKRKARYIVDTVTTMLTDGLRPQYRHVALSSDALSALKVGMEWLENYIAAPHDALGRTGDICPFVSPALKKEKIAVTVYSRLDRPDCNLLRRVLIAESRRLLKRAAREPDLRDRELTSSVLLFPALAGADGAAIGDAFNKCQGITNERGAMVAIFFPDNPKSAVYNDAFPIYRSPFPIAAIRPMAIHDILFVGNSREAFIEYHRRFAGHYRTGKVPRKTGFNERYADACSRFGLDGSSSPGPASTDPG